MHLYLVIPKIPFEGQNCQKWISSKMIPKWPSHFSFQTPSKQSQNYQNFRVWYFILIIHQGFKKCDLPFLCKMTILSLVLFLHNFFFYPYLTPKSWNETLLTQLTYKKITKD